MKKILLFAAMLCFFVSGAAYASSVGEVIQETERVLRTIIDETDLVVLSRVVRDGHGVAVVPKMSVYGIAFEREDGQWFGPNFFQLEAANAVLLFNMNDWRGVELFSKEESVIGTRNGVSAGPLFENDAAPASSAYSYEFSSAKGLLKGVDLKNFPIKTSLRLNREYWGRRTSAEEALAEPAGDAVRGIIALLNHITNSARDREEEQNQKQENKDSDWRDQGKDLLKKIIEDAIKKM